MSDDVPRPPPPMSQDTLCKIMWLYRTRTCPLNKRGQCSYGNRCFDSHAAQPERRPAKQNEYNDWHPSTMKCTSVGDEDCKYGRACFFAHNEFEIHYHPTAYKTKLCGQFAKTGMCSRGMICPNYHYPEEQRKMDDGSLGIDCKSDGVSRKAPPPQEFRRWLDKELRIGSTGCNHNDTKQNSHANGTNGVLQNLTLNKEALLDHDRRSRIDHMKKSQQEQGDIKRLSNHSSPQQSLPSSHPELVLRNISDSSSRGFGNMVSPVVSSSPYDQEAKWNHNRNGAPNGSRPEHYLGSASPIHSRAVTTPLSVSSVPGSVQMLPESTILRQSKSSKSKSSKLSNRRQKLLKQKQVEIEQKAVEIIKSYKITRCEKKKCDGRICPHFHNLKDRRRSPLQHRYCPRPCPRIFDEETRTFTDNSYGCPRGEQCEFAHNFVEIWYHPLVFHTKPCPLLKGNNCNKQQSCPWGFECSHYHKRGHRRRTKEPKVVAQIVESQRVQQRMKQIKRAERIASPSPHVRSGHIKQSAPEAHVPSHLPPHIAQALQSANQRQAAGLRLGADGNIEGVEGQSETQNCSADNAAYSFNPLMQGIAPTVNAWRQKVANPSAY